MPVSESWIKKLAYSSLGRSRFEDKGELQSAIMRKKARQNGCVFNQGPSCKRVARRRKRIRNPVQRSIVERKIVPC